jgi:AraC-like DNA-binding protein/quercetin dioxygenase-like cupin family protein
VAPHEIEQRDRLARAVVWDKLKRVPPARALYQRFLPEGSGRSFVWKYSQALGGRRPRHFHAEPELNVVVRGSARFGVGEALVTVAAGELLLFPPGQDHVLLEATPDLYLYAVGLEKTYSAAVSAAGGGALTPFHARPAANELERVIACATAIVDRAGTEQLGAELWERLQWLGRRTAEQTRGTHVLTRRALAGVEAAPELGLEALASDLGTHASEVSRHFHRDMGLTFVRYRTRLRLLDCIRLVDAGHPLMTAAGAAGFGSYAQCHRAFHTELGCGPQRFFYSGQRELMQREYQAAIG